MRLSVPTGSGAPQRGCYTTGVHLRCNHSVSALPSATLWPSTPSLIKQGLSLNDFVGPFHPQPSGIMTLLEESLPFRDLWRCSVHLSPRLPETIHFILANFQLQLFHGFPVRRFCNLYLPPLGRALPVLPFPMLNPSCRASTPTHP